MVIKAMSIRQVNHTCMCVLFCIVPREGVQQFTAKHGWARIIPLTPPRSLGIEARQPC